MNRRSKLPTNIKILKIFSLFSVENNLSNKTQDISTLITELNGCKYYTEEMKNCLNNIKLYQWQKKILYWFRLKCTVSKNLHYKLTP